MFLQQIALALTATATVDASRALLPLPPMGFNNWARFECDLNQNVPNPSAEIKTQTLFTETADAMVSKGLLKAGYDRVNIDDCWPLHERAANGSLRWDPELFPDGLIYLGRYLKERNLKFGIYSDSGNLTCGGYPGSLHHEEIDAKTFASWGIDYLKLDGCYVYEQPTLDIEETYKKIYGHWHEVLSETPLIFSESAPAYFSGEQNLTDWYLVMDWVPQYGELARHSDDIATFNSPDPWASILTNYGFEILLARYQSPGYFNDPDFLIVDHANLTMDKKKSQFALWSSFSAPLIISAYIPDLSNEEIGYLTNKDLIAVDQDALGLQATLISQDGTWDVLSKSLSNGDRLLTILNRGDRQSTLTVPLARLGYPSAPPQQLTVKDLWTGKASKVSRQITASVPSHGTGVFRVSASPQYARNVIPTGMIFNTASLNCLTSKGSSAAWAKCAASDAQVWQVEKDGSISSLADPTRCLSSNGGIAPCQRGQKAQEWRYAITGILLNGASGQCLMEAKGGGVKVSKCGVEKNAQVFELPSGSLQQQKP